MKENKKKIEISTSAKIVICSFSAIILIVSSFLIGFYVSKNKHSLSSEDQKVIDTYRLLKEEWLYGNELNNFQDEALTSLIDGMTNKENDPYTFYTENEEEQNLSLNGKGFGFTSHYYDGNLIITDIFKGPSKDKLEINDIITSITVDNETFILKDHTLSQIRTFLSKSRADNTVFTFNISRNNQNLIVDLVKGTYEQEGMEIKRYPTSSNDYSLVLKINTFLDQNLVNSVDNILNTAINNYQTINNLVIDLTDNGGGYVKQADELARLFVKKDTLIYKMMDKNDNVLNSSIQNKDPKYNFKNYKIIINNSSASASELFTLAMRKGTDATILGLKSYGKGVSQSFKTFSDGSVIRYTKALVYGPKRDNETITVLDKYDKKDIFSIHQTGIIPDNIYYKDYSFLNSFVEMNNFTYLSNNQVEQVIKVINELYPNEINDINNKRFDDVINEYTNIINNKYSLSLTPFISNVVNKEVSDILIKESYDKFISYKNDMLKEYYHD